jgi:hypothetical protein
MSVPPAQSDLPPVHAPSPTTARKNWFSKILATKVFRGWSRTFSSSHGKGSKKDLPLVVVEGSGSSTPVAKVVAADDNTERSEDLDLGDLKKTDIALGLLRRENVRGIHVTEPTRDALDSLVDAGFNAEVLSRVKHLFLPKDIINRRGGVLGNGTYGDVFRGVIATGEGEREVAIKVVRISPANLPLVSSSS